MSMNEKTEASKLYFCPNRECRVVTFKPSPQVHEVCPDCGGTGELLREATLRRPGPR